MSNFLDYDYKQNANLVLIERFRKRGRDEPSGEAESLVGKKLHAFGSLAKKEESKELKERIERAKKRREKKRLEEKKKRLKNAQSSVLESTDTYRPLTTQTKEEYSKLLMVIIKYLPSETDEVIQDAAYETIQTLRNSKLNEKSKKKKLSKYLENLSNLDFTNLTSFATNLVDFSTDDINNEQKELEGQDEFIIDFDKKQSSDSDEGFEVLSTESSTESDSENEKGNENLETLEKKKQEIDEENYLSMMEQDPLRVSAKEIGPYWLESQISKLYPDTEIAHQLSDEILKIIGNVKSDLRESEEKLVTLFNFEHLNFIKIILHNRYKIYLQSLIHRSLSDPENKELLEEFKKRHSKKYSETMKEIEKDISVQNSNKISSSELSKITSSFDDLVSQNKNKKNKSKETTKLKKKTKIVDESQTLKEIDNENEILRKKNQKRKRKKKLYDGRVLIDLENLIFEQGAHTMTNEKVKLGKNVTRTRNDGWQEIYVPPPERKKTTKSSLKKKKSQNKDIEIEKEEIDEEDEQIKKEEDMEKEGEEEDDYDDEEDELIEISSIPQWAQPAFKNMKTLNRIQSKVYRRALFDNDNILLCAPTGAGKTNVAMLSILHEIRMNTDLETGEIKLDEFKIVYIAPMKSLVQEMVGNFSNRLSSYGITVNELSGDQQLSKQQISRTQLIITTPEKWEIITRKAGEKSYLKLVKLIIIDEIHLLHDERGPVLESVIARTIRQIEVTRELVRIIALSATLPNYKDVATFLRVDEKRGLFYFDGSYRPCPLHQYYIGLTERSALKRSKLMDKILYEKIHDRAGSDHQILVFVHSRKGTYKTIRTLLNICLEKGTLSKIVGADNATKEILRSESLKCKSKELSEILPQGFAIHHAGMTRDDRGLVEELFAEKLIKVLCTTATLAWGVNLPARTVIIKGTKVYSPQSAKWVELSPLDVMQMFGRAGRPQFDRQGEGIILTSHKELQFYLSLLNSQLPIESQMFSKLIDTVNAEIVLGTIRNLKEGKIWLTYTYLYVRMLLEPTVYSIDYDTLKKDPNLEQFCINLIHTAATFLDKNKLIKYDRRNGNFYSTDLGKVASYYYITYNSAATFNEFLKSTMGKIELFRLFTLSTEFKQIKIREEEKLEVTKMAERVPIPIKEQSNDPSAKINLLLQSYISKFNLAGFSLASDMVYITQSAGRLFRGLFEISLRKGYAQLSLTCLEVCKMVDKRMWYSQSPLRQFKRIPIDIIKRIERNDFTWENLLFFKSNQIGNIIGIPKMGKEIHKYIHQIPRVELKARVQPITKNILSVELIIQPDFKFRDLSLNNNQKRIEQIFENNRISQSEPFWIIMHDVNCEKILHYEYFILKKKWSAQEHVVNFTVEISDPLPPQYFIVITSDRWIGSTSVLPISFRHLILPSKSNQYTDLLDLQPLPINYLTKQLQLLIEERLYKESQDSINEDNVDIEEEVEEKGEEQGEVEVEEKSDGNNDDNNEDDNKGKAKKQKKKSGILEMEKLKNLHLQSNKIKTQALQEMKDLNLNNIYSEFNNFNPIQTQTFKTLLLSDKSALICAPNGSGKTVCAEITILGMIAKKKNKGKCVYISPKLPILKEKFDDWSDKFQNTNVAMLTGELAIDLKIMESNQIIMTTPEKWDHISRSWKLKRAIRNIDLFIVDDLHLIGSGEQGSVIEIIISRMRYISSQTERALRIVALSSSIANAIDVGEWIGCSERHIFNFHSNVRPIPLEIHIQGFSIPNFKSRILAMQKPTYLAISKHCFSQKNKDFKKPTLIFTASAHYSTLCASELLTYAASEADPDKFLFCSLKEVQSDIEQIEDPILKELTSHGIGFLNKELNENDQILLQKLFLEEKIGVLVVENSMCWELPLLSSYFVIIQGAQKWDSLDHRFIDLDIYSIIEMNGKNCRPTIDNIGKTLIMCSSSKKEYFTRFLFQPFPIESSLLHFLPNHLNSEVVNKTIENKQEAVDYLTWTFFYKRLTKNPNFYGLHSISTNKLSEFLSDFVEKSLKELEISKCILVDDDDDEDDDEDEDDLDLIESKSGKTVGEVAPLNIGLIASYYYINYTTIDVFSNSLTKNLITKDIFKILCYASEFRQFPVRYRESRMLKRIAKHLRWKIEETDYSQIPLKAHILFQSYFSRFVLPYALDSDLKLMLPIAIRLLRSIIDIISTNGWLKPALHAMVLSQMFVQALFQGDSALKQLPFFNEELIKRSQQNGINDIFDLLDYEDDEKRAQIIDLSEEQLNEVAIFSNRYPIINVDYLINKKDEIVVNSKVSLVVQLERDLDEEDDEDEDDVALYETILSPYYPEEKDEQWWVVVGNIQNNSLLSIKKIPLIKKMKANLSFNAPSTPGIYQYTLYFICDSYYGVDEQLTFQIKVKPKPKKDKKKKKKKSKKKNKKKEKEEMSIEKK
ncbi:u5 small nuclear ribonucleoprotein 200 kda helicase [Anaeramoeba flamelloides]|uniref:U5 small nuclear ribonucleoprotein 200 kDa helicase n=1 Tax=Anaeramoeba flamelloides TaxID=1746091 RepID=A0AAV7Y9Y5_9EUKA|nr:u5 small nuclear ribonucleoprotein 200 kda helicase [Anaeramoeba flamelloides]